MGHRRAWGFIGCLMGLWTSSIAAQQVPKIELEVVKLNPRCVGGVNNGERCANDCNCDTLICESHNICVEGADAGSRCETGAECASNSCRNDPRCVGGVDDGALCERSSDCESAICLGAAPFVTPTRSLTGRPGDWFLSEVFASEWSPNAETPEKLRSWEVSVPLASLSSGGAGQLSFVEGDRCCRERIVVPPPLQRLDQDCRDLGACCGTTCGVVDAQEGVCINPQNPYPPIAKGVFITRDRADYVFATNGTTDFLLLDIAVGALSVRWAATLGLADTPLSFVSGSSRAYLATVVLEASAEVCGVFAIPIAPASVDGLFAPSGTRITTLNLGLSIDFGACECLLDLDCDDGVECTVDVCDPTTASCTHTQAGECLTGGGLSPLPEQVIVAKNRYLSFDPSNTGCDTALQVTLTQSDDFPEAVGLSWWVGQPQTICENSGQVFPPAGGCATAGGTLPRTMTAARLQCSRHCANWNAVNLVHVHGRHVVPGAAYEIRAVDCGCDPTDSANFTASLGVSTSPQWADVCGTGPRGACSGPPEAIIDIQDFVGLINKFANVPFSLSKALTDLSSTDQRVNTVDLQITVADLINWSDVFEGLVPGFPFAGPARCP